MLGKESNKKVQKIITAIVALLIFGYNSFIYLQNGIMIQKSNNAEKQYFEDVITEIENYETENQIQIENIVFYEDAIPQKTFYHYPNNSFTIKTLHTTYGRLESLKYYLKRDLKEVQMNHEYEIDFKNNEWENFEKEQMIFEGNTLHLCVY